MAENNAIDICKYKSKTLVYFCVFSNRDYSKLLNLLLTSLVLFTKDLSQIDLLVFTSRDLEEEIKQLARPLNLRIDTYIFNFTGKDQAVCSKLYIFEYPLTQEYKQVLYLDTDIIIQTDLNIILNVPCLEEKLYGVKEGTIGHEWWGAELFDFSKTDSSFRNLSGINGGTFLFRPTDKIKRVFENICNDIKERASKNIALPVCSDQSYINYFFIKDAIYNTTFLTEYTKFYSKDAIISEIVSNNVLSHFTWPIGNANNKMERMKPHLLHILKNYRESSANTLLILVGIIYQWDQHGWIRFEANGLLVTKWCQGTYEWLGTHYLYASWAGLTHFLRFNDDYSGFISVRLGDLDFINGTRINNNVSIILTSTVNVNTKDSYFLTDSSERLNQYIKSVRLWLENTKYNIVLVENSGYAFQELSEEREKFCGRFEILSFKGMDEAPEYIIALKDKGLHELFSINYALNNSRLIHKSNFVIKVTGRYYIPDFETYTNTFNLDLYDCILQNGYRSNSRCEMFGCQLKYSRDVFSLTIEPEYLTYPYNVVESIYKKRIEKYNSLECKEFSIEATVCCGNNRIYRNI
jgi:lipopolysaccharide biosynthesis glycosyltransferase